ncbi:MAG: P-loop NTPase [Acidimicrobiia bacterium]|nr:P-loop NTPase [Acidimicrobiia bacterium]MDH4363669.1 P-loop NTPase [Acidimicrobiia bacterium]
MTLARLPERAIHDRPERDPAERRLLNDEAALLDPGRIAAAARRRWRLLVFVPLALATASSLTTSLQSRRYEAAAAVVLHPTGSADAADRSSETITRELKTEAQLLDNPQMALLIEAQLGDDFSYSAEPVMGTEILAITATAASAQRSADAANAVAELYLSERRQRITEHVERQLADAEALVADLEARIASQTATSAPNAGLTTDSELEAARALVAELLRARTSTDDQALVASRAVTPDRPVSPKPIRNLALSGVTGMVLALALVWLRERTDKRLRTLADLDDLYGHLECFGTVSRPAQLHDSGPAVLTVDLLAEQFRVLATGVAQREERSYVIQIAGVRGGEGASYVAANLAATLAVGGWGTALVDADLNHGAVHRIFHLHQRPGTMQLLGGDQLAATIQRSEKVGDLAILTTGAPSGGSVSVHGTGLHVAVERLGAHFDIVLLDSPPILGSGDAAVLAHHADKTVLVAQADRTTRDDVAAAVLALRSAGGNLTGIVLTDEVSLSSLTVRLRARALDRRYGRQRGVV